nr:MAG TPA: hypothetical protein [Caudoviricetes sp.]
MKFIFDLLQLPQTTQILYGIMVVFLRERTTNN